jgi:hypothetical protein
MNESLDQKWFEQLRVLSSKTEEGEWMQRSMQIEADEKEQFLADDIENPQFAYEVGVPTKLIDEEITAFMSDLATSERDAIVLDLYNRKLTHQLTRSHLLAASYAGNDQQFYQLSTDLYGKPRKKYFSYIAKKLQRLCKETMSEDPATRRLCRMVSKIDTKAVDIDATMLPPLVEDSSPITTIAQVEGIFTTALAQYGLKGWVLVVDKTGKRSRFSVNNQQKVINIPAESQLLARATKLTEVNIEALAAHEIGVHARRSAAGEESKLQLLRIGLDSYLPGEEGVAGYVQQQVEGATEFYGFDRYMAASFAIGLDGTKRDFRGVFSIMVDYYIMRYATGDGVTTKKLKQRAQQAAWEVCVRIFRGTTGKTPGCIYTKDIVYLEGNISIWNLLTEKPHVFPELFVGKYNPLLSRHIKSLQTLGIIKDW